MSIIFREYFENCLELLNLMMYFEIEIEEKNIFVNDYTYIFLKYKYFYSIM